jgi:hypothetical protein
MKVAVQVHGALRGAAGAAERSMQRLLFGPIASLLGDFYVKYCVVKAGVYVPTVGALGPAR